MDSFAVKGLTRAILNVVRSQVNGSCSHSACQVFVVDWIVLVGEANGANGGVMPGSVWRCIETCQV